MVDEELPPSARSIPPSVLRQPRRQVLVIEASGVLVLTGVIVATASDPAALILTVPLLGAALLLFARDVVLRPVLTADASGACIRANQRRRCFTWSTVDAVVVDAGRGGLGGYLVIDTVAGLIQVPAWRLGGDVTALAAELNALRGHEPRDALSS